MHFKNGTGSSKSCLEGCCYAQLLAEFLTAIGAKAIAVFAHRRVSLAIAAGRKLLINFFATAWAKTHGRIAAAMVHIATSFFVAHATL
jgi:hypothetical protein